MYIYYYLFIYLLYIYIYIYLFICLNTHTHTHIYIYIFWLTGLGPTLNSHIVNPSIVHKPQYSAGKRVLVRIGLRSNKIQPLFNSMFKC